MSEGYHPFVTAATPDGPKIMGSWNGQAYECVVCHATHATIDAANTHANKHLRRFDATRITATGW